MESTLALSDRLAFLRLGARDLEVLSSLRPLFESNADTIVEAFYRHLLAFDEPRRFLTDAALRDRLFTIQRDYLMSLTDPRIDDDYVEGRLRIGRMHERIGLAPSWYLGAYEIYLGELVQMIDTHFGPDLSGAAFARAAMRRRILLDAQLAMEAYVEKRSEQLEFLNRELAASQRGLTREVDEKSDALRETTARAQAAEQLASVGMLAAGLAHEIGTPMGVIRGHAESLEGAVEDERSQWRVRTIIEQIDRITNIMQSLLNLARPRAPVVEPVALADVIDTASSFVREKLERRKIEVVREFRDVPQIQGDGEKLQQLFLNLILNAADAMRDGGTLTLRLESDGDGLVVATVSDTGCGIEESDRDRIFEPFFTSKQAGQGSGLGLVITRGIAIDHGGDLRVRSRVGTGSDFVVELPVGGSSGATQAV